MVQRNNPITTSDDGKPIKTKGEFSCPRGWDWEDPNDAWAIDHNRACDKDGMIIMNVSEKY